MYEVTYSIDGIIKKINVSAEEQGQVFDIITNMFRTRKSINYKYCKEVK